MPARSSTTRTPKSTAKPKKAAASKSPRRTTKNPTRTRHTGALPAGTPRTTNPLGHLAIEEPLRQAGFAGGISSDPAILATYSTDESIFSITPRLILQPHTPADVAIATQVVRAHSDRFPALSLTPRAAGTGLSGGSLTDSIVLDVCRHLHAIDPPQLTTHGATITCQPGALWRDVEKALRQHQMYIPSFPASKDMCSIGGAVSNNSAGPDSLRYGHCAEWVESLEVILQDGQPYTIKPLTYKQFTNLLVEQHELARIAAQVFEIIAKNEKSIAAGRPNTKKNSAGYALWDVLPQGVSAFKKGEGRFDLTRLFTGSQGTIGIIVGITMRAIPIPQDTTLVAIPLFDLAAAADTITNTLQYNPINVEFFDGRSFELAQQNPAFFKQRLPALEYHRMRLSMQTLYTLRWKKRVPELMLLVTLDSTTTQQHGTKHIVNTLTTDTVSPRIVTNKTEQRMLWQIRRSSYTLSKFQDTSKRPAAFLEDMTVEPAHLAAFFTDIKQLLETYQIQAAVHGHGGNGHFHFYPLLDFTDASTPALVTEMAEAFYNTAIKHKGNICGEHNDGIIRTPHLGKLFTKKMLDIFQRVEAVCDPYDIFNPGKKVNPRFDIQATMRQTN